MRRHLLPVAAAGVLALAAGTADAASLRITVTNFSASGGLSLTPVYGAFHNGSVDLFDVGGSASAGVETLAELGVFMGGPDTLAAERTAIQADSQGVPGIFGTDFGPGTVDPGETASVDVVVADAATNRFFTFVSMLVPSNDTFIANDDPQALEVFDANGAFNGPLSFDVTSANIFDAGTEDNDLTNGPAFVGGVDATGGAETLNGLIALSTGIGDIPNGFAGLAGPIVAAAANAFVDDPNFVLARIEVEAIPLPATVLMMAAAMAGLITVRSGRRT